MSTDQFQRIYHAYLREVEKLRVEQQRVFAETIRALEKIKIEKLRNGIEDGQ